MLKRRHRLAMAIISIALAAIVPAACDFGLLGPSGSGVIEATLISPYGAKGAAVLELTGGVALGVVASEYGDTFYEHHGDTTRAVIVLDEAGSIRFTVRTEDIGKLPTVTVIQVAGGDNRLRADVSGYEVEFVRHEDLGTALQRRAP